MLKPFPENLIQAQRAVFPDCECSLCGDFVPRDRLREIPFTDNGEYVTWFACEKHSPEEIAGLLP